MAYIAYLILGVYIFALLFIGLHAVMQFQLWWHYWRKRKQSVNKGELKKTELPVVTVQLPIYNEMYVTERLIDNIMAIDYPADLLEVQVLDDSTDETCQIAAACVAAYQEKGCNIKHIHRTNRQGFKAGALQAGTAVAQGEFIVIFDADFLPQPDFLQRTLPFFSDERVAVVQTRWEHINEQYSMLTRWQALCLNVHFVVEQAGRCQGNYFLQFNGTAGVWRKEAIADAGGWQADTLTEDLDLSYRAQLKGWRIQYVPEVASPAELPAEMQGLKSQQFRWMKGGAESARKLLPTIWQAPQLSFSQKLQATDHLMASGVFLLIFVAGVLSVPLLFLMHSIQFNPAALSIFLVGFITLFIVYFSANLGQVASDPLWKKGFKLLFLFPVFLALSMGLSLHNSIAVVQGYIGKRTAFVRTPKFGLMDWRGNFRQKQYRKHGWSWTMILEALLSLYFIGAMIGAVYTEAYAFILFHLLLAIGFGTISFLSFRHLRIR